MCHINIFVYIEAIRLLDKIFCLKYHNFYNCILALKKMCYMSLGVTQACLP